MNVGHYSYVRLDERKHGRVTKLYLCPVFKRNTKGPGFDGNVPTFDFFVGHASVYTT
jgi:hypothetical protein